MPAERPGAAGNAPVEIDSIAAIRWLIRRAIRRERRDMPCHDLPELSAEDLANENQAGLLELPSNLKEVAGKETIEVAAGKAGFGNKETYRQASRAAHRLNERGAGGVAGT